MVRDHGQYSASLQLVTQERERPLQRAELVVYGNANRLEEPSEVTRPRARTVRTADRVDEIVTHVDWLSLATTHDLPRQPAGAGGRATSRAEAHPRQGRSQIRRAHGWTSVTATPRTPSSA